LLRKRRGVTLFEKAGVVLFHSTTGHNTVIKMLQKVKQSGESVEARVQKIPTIGGWTRVFLFLFYQGFHVSKKKPHPHLV